MKIRIDPLDKLFSEFIRKRARGICERCGSRKGWDKLQCSHFFGRAKKSTRWDEENASALCFGCHQYFTSHPLEHADWFQARLGEGFDLLVRRANTPQKPDREAIGLYLTAKLKEVRKCLVGKIL